MAAALAVLCLFLTGAAAIYWIRKDAREWQHAWKRREEQIAVERRDLIDRIMYMADRPWQLPPSEQPTEDAEPYVDDALDEPLPAVIDYDQIVPADRV